MEFSDYVNTIRRHFIAITVIVLIGAMAGFLFARSSAPMYKASSSVFVSANRGENASDLVQGSVYTQNLMQSYAKLVQTPSVLGPVIKSLNLDISEVQLGRQVSADAPLNTVMIVVTVTDESPDQAATIANAVTNELNTVARDLSPKNADGSPSVSLVQVGKATPPPYPFAPNTSLLVVGGGGLGLLIALALVVARRLIERRIQTEADLKAATRLAVLGQLPLARRTAKRGKKATEVSRDAFLRLADRVANAPGPVPLRSVVVTSAGPSEGKTHTATSLALALGEFHGRVLLIDANLRSPDIATVCGVDAVPGLNDVINLRASTEGAISAWQGIWVMPAGTACQNPTQQLNSPAMEKVVIELLRNFDFIVCDSAPVLGVADSLPLTRVTDGAVVVVQAGKTKRAQVVAAADSVAAAGGEVTGFVLNGVRRNLSLRFLGLRTKRSTRPEADFYAAKTPVSKRTSGVASGNRRP